MIGEEKVLITPPKPLNSSELETVGLHKLLTECWRRNSFSKVGFSHNISFNNEDSSNSHSSLPEDVDYDSNLKSFLETCDCSLIPDELLYTNNLESINHHVENFKAPNQKLSAKLKKMELKENDYKHDDSQPQERIEIENLFNEPEDVDGDYKYSFCEEEELDHETEYNL